MPFKENRTFWEEFIELYRSQSCLWAVNSENYSNRRLRENAYKKLVEKCKTYKPTADKHYVVKNINSLRASFRRQHRKLEQARQSRENSEKNLPQPTLWYYPLLSFLLDQEYVPPTNSLTKIKEKKRTYNESSADEDVENEIASVVNSPTESLSEIPPATAVHTKTFQTKISNETQDNSWENNSDLEDLKEDISVHYLQDDPPENVSSVFGKSVGLELDLVVNREQKDIAKKLISDVLFLAKMGKLTCDSHVQIQLLQPVYSLQRPSTQNQPQSGSSNLQDDSPEYVSAVFGKSVGLEIDLIVNREQQDIAKKLISDVLFLAKIGKLTCDSHVQIQLLRPIYSLQRPSTQNQPQSGPSNVYFAVTKNLK